jgi:catalase
MVRGIGPSPDKMLLGRLFSYPDTHRHRIGTNYLELPVNRPLSPVHSYNRDGAMRHSNPPDPVYAPNSFGGPKADPAYELPNWQIEAGEIARTAYVKHANDDDFVQPRTLYREVLSATDRDHLVTNIVGHLKEAVKSDMQQRAVQYWTKVDATLGARIRATLEGNRGDAAAVKKQPAHT